MKCPNCGAEIEQNSRSCSYCNMPITVEMMKTQEQLNKSGCPECGSTNISFKRENKGEVRSDRAKYIVHMTVGFCKDCGYTWSPEIPENQEPPKQKSKMWLWVLGWIFIFPVPLTILMLRNKEMSNALKYGIIAAAWIVYLGIAIYGSRNNSDKQSTTVANNVLEEVTTEVMSENVNKTEEKNSTEVTTEEDVKYDFMITVDEKGEYGEEYTLNAGTECEETQIIYKIDPGKYKVKYLGQNRGQLDIYSYSTKKNINGWDEPEYTKPSQIVNPGDEVNIEIEDGYYLVVNADGQLGFIKAE